MTATDAAPALDTISQPGCRQVTDGVNKRPFCEVATEVAVARKSALEECVRHAHDAQAALERGEADQAAWLLGRIIVRGGADEGPVEVPADEVLTNIVRALESIVTAEPSALLEQALEVRRYIAEDGWVIVRAEGCQS